MKSILLQPPAGPGQWLRLFLLYRISFPRAERKPFLTILKKYRAGMTDIWYFQQNGQFLGFAATMNSPDLVMLDYLAVCKQHRGTGIGTAAMQMLMQRYADREFLLEIESPFVPGPDQCLRQKRKQFYVNCGMEPLHIMADVFGVQMELLGKNCTVDFDRYRSFYQDFYKPWAAKHILPAAYPEQQKTPLRVKSEKSNEP